MRSRCQLTKKLIVLNTALLFLFGASLGCTEGDITPFDGSMGEAVDVEPDLYSYAGGCFGIQEEGGLWLQRDGDGFAFMEGDAADATPFYMKASTLATYLLYDSDRGYVVAEDGPLLRKTHLHSDPSDVINHVIYDSEWKLEAVGDPVDKLYHLVHLKNDEYLGLKGLTFDVSGAVVISFEPASNCAQFPEMSVDAKLPPKPRDLSLDAEGTVKGRQFADGSVWGLAEPHTHIMSNWGFGGGGVVHGAPYHRLGVEHALGDCSGTHGTGGVRDLFGTVFDGKFSTDFIFNNLLPAILTGNFGGMFHETDGYPNFTDWPSAFESTHQNQYYTWIKRAWMGGLRLMVQFAVSNSVICELSRGLHLQEPLTKCNDMVDVDREIDDIYAMQDYIDAQAGGPGKGFFRIVKSPEEARQVILDGKLAVVLGIETSDLFDCFSVPRPGAPACTEGYVKQTLDFYHSRGIRAIFPVHKFDNAFSAGDGSDGFIEVGNFLKTGQMSNFTGDCPNMPVVFDKTGPRSFAGLNQPRDEYISTPPYDMTGLGDHILMTVLPHVPKLMSGALGGNYCQKAGLTKLGEFLIRQMMNRGMMVEVDHLPQRAYKRAFEILREFNYPAVGGHGTKGPDYEMYKLGGISTAGIGRCHNPDRKGTTLDGLRNDIAKKIEKGAYPGESFSWDLNGFAGEAKPRFGPNSECNTPQSDPITYPFKSYGGDITFTKPRLGNRVVDFNTEGLVHIGLMPEFIEDLRKDAESDADLEPLFRGAEAYLRMWGKAENRSKEISTYPKDDWCPSDPYKHNPGQCGCGIVDIDGDGDGTANCRDNCPSDANKTQPGVCGCGTLDTDLDGDGVLDCNDNCATDPNKTQAGICGCGAPDVDSDGDGVADCNDNCPNDANKKLAGVCGCGVADVDSDGDGIADCNDKCPGDPDKLENGVCGCGAADGDSDGDGVADCLDTCPSDPDKVDLGACGCGAPDVDSDGDGVADCIDLCAADPSKVEAGICGCGVGDADSDGDTVVDCLDNCAADPGKTEAGVCGCGTSDVDSDGDGTADCLDQCDNDPGKTTHGVCGCGVADTDSDGDGTPDCRDQCPSNPYKTTPGHCGCNRERCSSGVHAEYYRHHDLTDLVTTRTESTINFDWGLGAPAAWMGWGWGARWTGYVEATANEEYTFYTESDDGARLWVNDVLIIDDWRPHGVEEHSGRIRLEAGKQYKIKLEYFDKWGGAVCRLRWSSPRNGKQIVPASQLSH